MSKNQNGGTGVSVCGNWGLGPWLTPPHFCHRRSLRWVEFQFSLRHSLCHFSRSMNQRASCQVYANGMGCRSSHWTGHREGACGAELEGGQWVLSSPVLGFVLSPGIWVPESFLDNKECHCWSTQMCPLLHSCMSCDGHHWFLPPSKVCGPLFQGCQGHGFALDSGSLFPPISSFLLGWLSQRCCCDNQNSFAKMVLYPLNTEGKFRSCGLGCLKLECLFSECLLHKDHVGQHFC